MRYTAGLIWIKPPSGFESLCEKLRFAYVGFRMLDLDYDMVWAKEATSVIRMINNELSTGREISSVLLYDVIDSLHKAIEKHRDDIPKEIYHGLEYTLASALEEVKL